MKDKSEKKDLNRRSPLLSFVKKHPYIVIILIACTVIGAICGYSGILQSIVGINVGPIKGSIGGALIGFFWGMIPTVSKMFD